jgi:hypothetical protein
LNEVGFVLGFLFEQRFFFGFGFLNFDWLSTIVPPEVLGEFIVWAFAPVMLSFVDVAWIAFLLFVASLIGFAVGFAVGFLLR